MVEQFPMSAKSRKLVSTLAAAVLILPLMSCGSSSSSRSSGEKPAAAPVLQATGRTGSLPRLAGDAPYNLEQIGPVMNPLSSNGINVPAAAPLTFAGWAVDGKNKALAVGVELVLDGTPLAAQYSMDRPDVAAALKVPAYARAGFSLALQPGQIKTGLHTVAVRVIAQDGSGYYEGTPIEFLIQ